MIRKDLSATGLISILTKAFYNIDDPRINKNNIQYSLPDILKSGLAIFSLKYPSLLKFCKDAKNPLIEKNIKSLFNISNIPSDTQLRDVIDPIPFESLRPAFDAILSSVQRGNELQKFITLGHYAIALDGTGYFSSSAVKCKHCLTKKIKIKKELKKEEVDDYDDDES